MGEEPLLPETPIQVYPLFEGLARKLTEAGEVAKHAFLYKSLFVVLFKHFYTRLALMKLTLRPSMVTLHPDPACSERFVVHSRT